MKFIELFAGIGGFRLGLERTGHECVYASEWLEKPRSVYQYNFKDIPDEKDIRTINPLSIPEADLICGGFPCATFSIAGKRTGFNSEDTRGTLFFEICRIAQAKRTPYLFLENVKGLLNHDNGRTFAVILTSLDKLGYDIQWQVCDSQNYGVPQHRERVFIIANLRGHPRPKVFPLGQASEQNDAEDRGTRKERKRMENWDTIACPTIDAHYSSGPDGKRALIDHLSITQYREDKEVVTQFTRGHFREFKSEGTPTLTANMGTGGHNVPFLMGSEKILVGSTLIPEDNEQKVMAEIITSTVKVRKHKVDTKRLVELLRKHRTISNTLIAEKLNVPQTQVDHWFRTDKHFAIPDPEVWYQLKELLNITTDEFDLPITEFEIKDNEFEMANRVYNTNGLAPTLTASNNAPSIKMTYLSHTQGNMKERTQDREVTWTLDTSPQNKMVVHQPVEWIGDYRTDEGLRIRKKSCSPTLSARKRSEVDPSTMPPIIKQTNIRRLTPLECERLQGLPDDFTKYYHDGKLVSDSERYERCGRTVSIPVIEAIGKRLHFFYEA